MEDQIKDEIRVGIKLDPEQIAMDSKEDMTEIKEEIKVEINPDPMYMTVDIKEEFEQEDPTGEYFTGNCFNSKLLSTVHFSISKVSQIWSWSKQTWRSKYRLIIKDKL